MKYKMVEVGKVPSKINMPNSITYLNLSPILEWCMATCEPKNGYQKGMWLKEIGLCAQNLLSILDSTININEGVGEQEKKNASLSSYDSNTFGYEKS